MYFLLVHTSGFRVSGLGFRVSGMDLCSRVGSMTRVLKASAVFAYDSVWQHTASTLSA